MLELERLQVRVVSGRLGRRGEDDDDEGGSGGSGDGELVTVFLYCTVDLM